MRAAPDPVRVRLVVLAAIGALAAFQWGSLLADPPTARLLGVVAVAVVLGCALESDGSRRRRPAIRHLGGGPARRRRGARRPRPPARSVAAVGTGIGWRTGSTTGLTGLGGQFDYPFADAGDWSRLLLVARSCRSRSPPRSSRSAPAGTANAVPIARLRRCSWPPSRSPPPPGPPGRRCSGGWSCSCWSPPGSGAIARGRCRRSPSSPRSGRRDSGRVEPRRRGPADRLSQLDAAGRREGRSHSTGSPPTARSTGRATGKLLFRVESDRPSYWRASRSRRVLRRRLAAVGCAAARRCRPNRVPARSLPTTAGSTRTARFSMLDIESPLLISPGTPLAVKGVDGSDRDEDGTTHLDDEPLKAGAAYDGHGLGAGAAPARSSVRPRAAIRRRFPPTRSLRCRRGADLESIVAPIHLDDPALGHERGQGRGPPRARRDRLRAGRPPRRAADRG